MTTRFATASVRRFLTKGVVSLTTIFVAANPAAIAQATPAVAQGRPQSAAHRHPRRRRRAEQHPPARCPRAGRPDHRRKSQARLRRRGPLPHSRRRQRGNRQLRRASHLAHRQDRRRRNRPRARPATRQHARKLHHRRQRNARNPRRDDCDPPERGSERPALDCKLHGRIRRHDHGQSRRAPHPRPQCQPVRRGRGRSRSRHGHGCRRHQVQRNQPLARFRHHRSLRLRSHTLIGQL